MNTSNRFGLALVLAVSLILSQTYPPQEWRRAILLVIFLAGSVLLVIPGKKDEP